MYDIGVIKHINDLAATKPTAENPFNRQSSYHQSSKGIVLHSAPLRSTAFIEDPKEIARFLRDVHSARSASKQSAIIESYFAETPRGKKRVRQAATIARRKSS